MIGSGGTQSESRRMREETFCEQHKNEDTTLRRWESGTTLYLVLVIVLALIASGFLASGTPEISRANWPTDWRVMLLCTMAGTFGSGLSALVSALERIAQGREYGNGDKWPLSPNYPEDVQDDRREMFSGRMVRWFFCRPVLGAAMGAVTYAGLLGGTLLRGEHAETLLALAFFAFLAGLAAKALLDKLRMIFKALF